MVLIDWGLAKLLDTPGGEGDASTIGSFREQPGTPDLTVVGQALGTPAYMAPEQAAGWLDQIDARTDVYGLGAMLYEILTGQPPFFSSDTREVLRMVRETEPVPPSRHWPEVPPLLESACLRALSKDPARRFGTPTELADEVQKWQEVQRKLAEDALRASEALYHSLVETIPMNVWRKDAAGRFTFANQGFCQTMGIPLDELIGKTDFDLFPTELAEGYRQGDIKILTTGTTYQAIEEVIDAEGARRRIQIIKLPRSGWTGQNHRNTGNLLDYIAGELNLGAFLDLPPARSPDSYCLRNILPRSRHLSVASTDGSRTKKVQ